MDIFLGGAHPDLVRNLRHEVGHVIARRMLNAPGEDWAEANKQGRKYLELRRYPSHLPLDYQSQIDLAWEDRAAEWFAEDFAWWATPVDDREGFEYLASAKDPNTAPGLENYFDRLFYSGGGLPCNCTEISVAALSWKAPWSSPLFVAFVLAIINMAILLNNYIAVNSAAREAAAITGATGSVLAGEKAGREVLENAAFMGQGEVRAVQPRRGDSLVHVEATYETKLVAPGFAALLGGSAKNPTVTTKSKSSTILEYHHRTKDPWEDRKGQCNLKGLASEMCP
ncbi:MAG: pilus assembly protein [Candidatus Desulforudis sp.]|nr:pilus assembly protein [Desulforudis sp.]